MSHDVLALLDALLDDLASRIATKLRAPAPPTEYTQDSPPSGMSKRTYLDHCYAGHWASTKRGRLRVTSAADYEAWRESRPRRQKRVVQEIFDEDLFVRSGGKHGIR